MPCHHPPRSAVRSRRASARAQLQRAWAVAALLGGVAAQTLAASAAEMHAPGSAERGRLLLLQRHETGCILCHRVAGIAQGGELGPPLVGIGQFLSAGAVRARIADARRFNPETLMPPYFSTAGLTAVAPEYTGRTMLSEQGLADIVAYLMQPVAGAPSAAPREVPDGRR